MINKNKINILQILRKRRRDYQQHDVYFYTGTDQTVYKPSIIYTYYYKW